MSDLGDKFFKSHTGKAYADYGTLPSTDYTFDNLLKRARTGYGKQIVPVGWTQEHGRFFLTQEDRASHTHILGATQEGKSKLIELLIRSDIKNGYGATLIDPSLGGATAYKVLNYCISIGFEKVCLIDPSDFVAFDRIPVIQPFRFNAPHAVSAGDIMDALQVIWSVKDRASNPRLEKYIPAVIYALMASGLNLSDVTYLLSRSEHYEEVSAILQNESLDKTQCGYLKDARRTPASFEMFHSTVNRLNFFTDYLLKLVFGSSRDGLDWQKMLTEGWVILVNLDPRDVWGGDVLKQRLLGTMVINELLYHLSRLERSGWRKPHFLYIDEAGDYATRRISRILDLYGKTSLRLILAHQRMSHFEDQAVLDAVRQNAKLKVLFHSPFTVDREVMMRDMGYGGDLPDRQVSHVLRQLERGQAAIAVGKSSPKLIRINRIEDVKVPAKKIAAFKARVYSQQGFYTREQIEHDINARRPKPKTQPSDSPEQHERGTADQPAGTGSVPSVQGRTADGRTNRKNRRQAPPKRQDGAAPPPRKTRYPRKEGQS